MGGKTNTIEIVVHCYAVELPHYASLLTYQLSSLVLHSPKTCEVTATVVHTADARTEAVLDWFDGLPCRPSNVVLRRLKLSTPGELGRRAVGRNRAALASESNLIWFGDADQCYGDGCLDTLASLEWPTGTVMIYPERVFVHTDHALGEHAIAAASEPGLIDFDAREFSPVRYGRAIGGVQIVRGDFARVHGYLNNVGRWQRPTIRPFGDFRDDVAYRRFCLRHGRIKSVQLPSLYRLRHARNSYQSARRGEETRA